MVPVSVRFSTLAPERIADLAFDGVGALIRDLAYRIARRIHHIRIVACHPDHGVGAHSAIEAIVAGSAPSVSLPARPKS